MCLVGRRRVDAVDARLDVAARERREGVARVDRDGAVLRLDPFPAALGVENLQGRDGLPEQQRQRAQVRVPGNVELGQALVLLGAARRVVHVAQVVLALDVVLVVPDQLVLVGELEQDGEQAQELDYYLFVAFLRNPRLLA